VFESACNRNEHQQGGSTSPLGFFPAKKPSEDVLFIVPSSVLTIIISLGYNF
jgi:hypothetical protein